MNLQTLRGTRTQRARKPTRSELECLRCRHRFDVDDLNRVRSTPDNRSFIECVWCEACNEVRATPQADAPPRTVVLRIIARRRGA